MDVKCTNLSFHDPSAQVYNLDKINLLTLKFNQLFFCIVLSLKHLTSSSRN